MPRTKRQSALLKGAKGETTVERHQAYLDMIQRIIEEKSRQSRPFKTFYRKKPINAKAIKSLKQMTTEPVEQSTEPGNYCSFEAPPSCKPAKKYCDFTGLPAKYTDRKTGLQYHDADFFRVIQGMNESIKNEYLELRNAVTILK